MQFIKLLPRGGDGADMGAARLAPHNGSLGFDLDAEQSTGVFQVPTAVRHRAGTLLTRWGAQNA